MEMELMTPYDCYKAILPKILMMLNNSSSLQGVESESSIKKIKSVEYIYDSNPALINSIREHYHQIDGINPYNYHRPNPEDVRLYANKLKLLKSLDDDSLFVPESEVLGGFGYNIDGELVNINTLRYYESVLAINTIDNFFAKYAESDILAVDIGGGWGCFGHVFKTLIPNATYVIIDHPEALLLSCIYLSSLHPDKKIYIYCEEDFDKVKYRLKEFDFVLLPPAITKMFNFKNIDIAINMLSFEDMSSEQISQYLNWLHMSNVGLIYSHNRVKSPHNNQLSNVQDLMKSRFTVNEIEILNIAYTELNIEKNKAIKDKERLRMKKTNLLRLIYDSILDDMQFSKQRISVDSQRAEAPHNHYHHSYAQNLK